MDTSGALTAAEVVNTYPADRLARVLRDYGEERFARRIADALVREREPGAADAPRGGWPQIVARLHPGPGPAHRRQPGQADLPGAAHRGERRAGRAAPRAAGRLDAIAVGGRIAVLAYHSLEDRAVKRALAERSADTTPPGLPVSLPGSRPQFRLLTRGAEKTGRAGTGRQPAGRVGPAAGRRTYPDSRINGGAS